MKSGFFGVVNIGDLKLYVGEVHQIQSRWRSLMRKFQLGEFPHPQLQAAWNKLGDQRRFTFHTADEIAQNHQVLGKQQFFADIAMF